MNKLKKLLNFYITSINSLYNNNNNNNNNNNKPFIFMIIIKHVIVHSKEI